MSDDSSHDDILAAFIDDELAAKDLDALLTSLECGERRARLRRHMVVAQALRGGTVRQRDISHSLRAALSQEAPLAVTRRAPVLRQLRLPRRFAVPAGGLALAASVGLAAVIVSQPPTPLADTVPAAEIVQAPAQAPATMPVAAVTVAADSTAQEAPTRVATAASSETRELVIAAPEDSQRQVTARWANAPSPDSRSRLDSYLINHARHGGGYGLSGSLGYARIAAQTAQQQGEPHP